MAETETKTVSPEFAEEYEFLKQWKDKLEREGGSKEELEQYEQRVQRFMQQQAEQQPDKPEQQQPPAPPRNYKTEIQSADTFIQQPYSAEQPFHLLVWELIRVKAQQLGDANDRLTQQMRATPFGQANDRLTQQVYATTAGRAVFGIGLMVLMFGSAMTMRAILPKPETVQPQQQEAAK